MDVKYLGRIFCVPSNPNRFRNIVCRCTRVSTAIGKEVGDEKESTSEKH
jgi:hypothetical protein